MGSQIKGVFKQQHRGGKVNPNTSSGVSPPATLCKLKVHQVALLVDFKVMY